MGSIPTSSAEREGVTRTARRRVRCWKCGADHAANLFCPACESIQPLPEQADYFEVLGLPCRLVVDGDGLQRRYYELHRRLHPDLFQTGPQEARQASLRNTAAVNRAYRTLRDPLDRGLYWLTLQGESLGSNNNRVPPDLAALVFEVQEQLEEFRAARRGNGAEEIGAQVAAVRDQLAERQARLLEELNQNFAQWDANAADRRVLIDELKRILSALAYLGTLIRDVEKELEH